MMHSAEATEEALYGVRKRSLFDDLQGKVLEIGAGTGVNFPFVSAADLDWTCVEPNIYMHPYLKENARKAPFQVTIKEDSTESFAFRPDTYDAVISTLVLCSVPEPAAVIKKIHHSLKPGGYFYFIEHVISPEKGLFRFSQNALVPAWKLVGDGCYPNRDTERHIREAGFGHLTLDRFTGPLSLGLARPHIVGKARKTAST